MKQKWTRFCSMLMLCCLLLGVLPGRAAAAGFRDVPAGHWAGDSITRCASLDFFQGKTADTFGLGQSMTRAAAVVVLDRFFGWEDAAVKLPYTDVPADAWYAEALRSAYAQGVATAQTRAFRPNAPITREELAVMLIRALGYTQIAGVAQELPRTFTDISSSEGYIAMARDLGLVSGLRTDTFAPDNYATREQVAVILMRLYDKLNTRVGGVMGIVSSASEMTGLTVAAVDNCTVRSNGTVYTSLGSTQVKRLKSAAETAGAELLLYAAGEDLPEDTAALAEDLAGLVEKDGYDGLLLELPAATAEEYARLTALVSALRATLGQSKLHLILTLPEADDLQASCTALASAADGVVLRIEQKVRLAGGFPVAPVEALEEVYLAVAGLRCAGVEAAKISVMLTTQGVHYVGAEARGHLDSWEVSRKQNSGWTYGYSERYGCAWLEHGANEAIWYLDGRSATERVRLLDMLGTGGIWLEEIGAVSGEVLTALRG